MPTNLYALKPWYTKRLSWFIRLAVRRGLSPDLFTILGVVGAVVAAAGFALHPAWLRGLVVLIGVVLRLGGANLDGAVARARKVSRPLGFVLNELGDRVSDFIVFAGLYLYAAHDLRPYIFGVAMLSSLPTLVSVSGAAVGVSRINGGPFGKTERCLAFVVAAVLLHQHVALAVVLGVMAAGALLTTVTRSQDRADDRR